MHFCLENCYARMGIFLPLLMVRERYALSLTFFLQVTQKIHPPHIQSKFSLGRGRHSLTVLKIYRRLNITLTAYMF